MSHEVEVRVPETGDAETVDVVEILVSSGDRVAVEDPLLSLESDKATMEIPSPVAGEVIAVKVSLGDRVVEDALLVVIAAVENEAVAVAEPDHVQREGGSAGLAATTPSVAESGEAFAGSRIATETPETTEAPVLARFALPPPVGTASSGAHGVDRPVRAHAGPGVRRVARELGVDLAGVAGTGPHERIVETDLKAHVRATFESGGLTSDTGDSGTRADVTALERWRRGQSVDDGDAHGPVSTLACVVRAAIIALRAFPELGVADAPISVAIESADDEARGACLVENADSLGIADLALALESTGAVARGDATMSLRHSLGTVAARPCLESMTTAGIALAVGGLDVAARFSGSPDDALSVEPRGRFEPRVVIPLAMNSTAGRTDRAMADRILAHWAEILESPARLLL